MGFIICIFKQSIAMWTYALLLWLVGNSRGHFLSFYFQCLRSLTQKSCCTKVRQLNVVLQMLLDTHAVKTLLLEVPSLGGQVLLVLTIVSLQDGNWWCYIRWLFDCSVTYMPLHLIWVMFTNWMVDCVGQLCLYVMVTDPWNQTSHSQEQLMRNCCPEQKDLYHWDTRHKMTRT